MFSLSAAAYITNSPNVLLLEAGFIVEDSDTVSLHHKSQRWNNTRLCRVTVVVGILKERNTKSSEDIGQNSNQNTKAKKFPFIEFLTHNQTAVFCFTDL